MRAVLLTLTAAIVALPASLQAQTPQATVDRAVAAYGKVKTLRANFRQELTNPLMGRTFSARGEMLQRVPGQLAIRFTDPDGDRIVADGQYVWVYLPSTNPDQVIKMRASRSITGAHDVTAMFLDAPHERYTITDAGSASVEGRATRAVHLVPRDQSIPFRRATVWIDDQDGLIRQFEVTEQNGVVRKVTIESVSVNPPLPRSAFVFVPPRGVRVFDQTNSASR
jgi:outer membrane lipoprotein carrier protein